MIRLLDILISFTALIFLLPFWVLLAIWIKLDSQGPVFFTQFRVGQWNRDFRLFKFRTMRTDAEKLGQLTIGGRDPRITRAGWVLRKFKFDELPQLFNVLLGNMSMVGPRPEVRKYVEYYDQSQMLILQVKPGITDQASIEYSDENEVLGNSQDPHETYINEILPHKIELNQGFIKARNLGNYFRILGATIGKILS